MRQHLIDRAREMTDAEVIERLADPVGLDRLLAALSLSSPTLAPAALDGAEDEEDGERWDGLE